MRFAIGHRKGGSLLRRRQNLRRWRIRASDTIKALSGCEAVLCSKSSFEPWGTLEAAGISPTASTRWREIGTPSRRRWNEKYACRRQAGVAPQAEKQA